MSDVLMLDGVDDLGLVGAAVKKARLKKELMKRRLERVSGKKKKPTTPSWYKPGMGVKKPKKDIVVEMFKKGAVPQSEALEPMRPETPLAPQSYIQKIAKRIEKEVPAMKPVTAGLNQPFTLKWYSHKGVALKPTGNRINEFFDTYAVRARARKADSPLVIAKEQKILMSKRAASLKKVKPMALKITNLEREKQDILKLVASLPKDTPASEGQQYIERLARIETYGKALGVKVAKLMANTTKLGIASNVLGHAKLEKDPNVRLQMLAAAGTIRSAPASVKYAKVPEVKGVPTFKQLFSDSKLVDNLIKTEGKGIKPVTPSRPLVGPVYWNQGATSFGEFAQFGFIDAIVGAVGGAINGACGIATAVIGNKGKRIDLKTAKVTLAAAQIEKEKLQLELAAKQMGGGTPSWLLPAVAGVGILAVGGAVVMMAKKKKGPTVEA